MGSETITAGASLDLRGELARGRWTVSPVARLASAGVDARSLRLPGPAVGAGAEEGLQRPLRGRRAGAAQGGGVDLDGLHPLDAELLQDALGEGLHRRLGGGGAEHEHGAGGESGGEGGRAPALRATDGGPGGGAVPPPGRRLRWRQLSGRRARASRAAAAAGRGIRPLRPGSGRRGRRGRPPDRAGGGGPARRRRPGADGPGGRCRRRRRGCGRRAARARRRVARRPGRS